MRFDPVYVFDHYGRARGFGLVEIPDDAPAMLPETKTAIERALDPAEVIWVERVGEVASGDRTTELPESTGAVLKIAPPRWADGSAYVTIELYCGPVCGVGGTARLESGQDGWEVVGEEGAGFTA
ncbi:MAG: hypothetical protein R2705_22950 [Ilumatobacteraceae bacterium]